MIRTRDQLDFTQGRFETRSHHISFRVTACMDAHVGLASTDEFVASEMYEVVIGASGNTRSAIRCEAQKCDLVNVETPYILDCDRERSFWVAWQHVVDGGSTA